MKERGRRIEIGGKELRFGAKGYEKETEMEAAEMYSETQLPCPSPRQLRWEFIKENKKTRFRPRKLSIKKEKKKKETRPRQRKRPRKKKKTFSFS